MVTPRVVEEVRRHFNCSTLEGAELEDQGGEGITTLNYHSFVYLLLIVLFVCLFCLGTALTHWEKRAFENEAMTGTHTQNPVYSRITLALMEDTGWYKARMEMAQPLNWGKNLGCAFAQRSCMEWMETKAARYFNQQLTVKFKMKCSYFLFFGFE